MKLKAVLDSLDDLDEPFHQLYTKKDDKYLLTGVEGIKTQADMERVNRSLAQEKEAHKKTKEKLAQFSDYLDDVEGTLEKLSSYDDLVARAEGKGKNDNQLTAELAETKKQLTIVTKERDKLRGDYDGVVKVNTELTAAQRRRAIGDEVRTAAGKAKMLDTAVEDAMIMAERVFEVLEDGEVRTKEGVGVTPGNTVEEWLSEIQTKRPHWWPASVGGGAKGSGGGAGQWGKNPWTAEEWNLTEQGRIYTADPAKAERMAKAAGSEVGARKPPVKK